MTKKHRSPSYPAIDLETAIGMAERIYPAGKHLLGAGVIAQEWGYKGLNSASPYIAALKQFGLLTEEAGNGDRMLRLTPRALDIIVDRDGKSAERRKGILDAATAPSLHEELWKKWGEDLPPLGEIRRYLERERDFNPNHVDKFIDQFLTTLKFSGHIGGTVAPQGALPAAQERTPVIGSLVQWTSNGVDQFIEPRRVRAIDESGEWALIDGSDTGIAVSELTVLDSPASKDPPAVPQKPSVPNPFTTASSSMQSAIHEKAGFEIERATLDEGPVVLQWPSTISKESFEELEYWLQGVIRRARRKAGIPKQRSDDQSGDQR